MKCETKYAPQNLDEVIYASNAQRLDIHAHSTYLRDRHVMLYGPNGTGKTTVANLLVRAIGGEHASIEQKPHEELLEMKNLSNYLLQAAAFARLTTSEKHFLVLNELDNAKKDVHRLWTALDDCGDGVLAIITTNYPMATDKSIRSRFDLIGMPAVTAPAALPRVQYILQAEGLNLPNQQVLNYLQEVEYFQDLRKYFKVADELLYLTAQGLPYPDWSETTPSLTVV